MVTDEAARGRGGGARRLHADVEALANRERAAVGRHDADAGLRGCGGDGREQSGENEPVSWQTCGTQ
jgi:hypothetical protein